MKPVAWYRIEGRTHAVMPFRSDPDADKHGWSPAYAACPADQLEAIYAKGYADAVEGTLSPREKRAAEIVAKMRKDLTSVGGFDNRFVGQLAVNVRDYILELEDALVKVGASGLSEAMSKSTNLAELEDGGVAVFSAEGEYSSQESSVHNLVEVSPYADWKIDQRILVSDDEVHWDRRYFAGINENGDCLAWTSGATSWSQDLFPATTRWEYARLPTPEELGEQP